MLFTFRLALDDGTDTPCGGGFLPFLQQSMAQL